MWNGGPIIVLVLLGWGRVAAQPGHMVRLYEDNDYINLTGKHTDKGYTNGTEIAYCFNKSHASRFRPDRWLPAAGRDAVNTYSYALTQLMFTPTNLKAALPDKYDWPYAGALVLSHGLYSTNSTNRWALMSKVTAGVIGPFALTEQTQELVHRMICDRQPRGWKYQMPNDILVNLAVGVEKMFWRAGRMFEAIGGAEGQAGTMLNGMDLHVLLRAGIMQPYFGGYIGRYSQPRELGHRFQLYVYARPVVQWWGYNALLEGGVFAGRNRYYTYPSGKRQAPSLERITTVAEIGAVLAMGNVSFSLAEKELSPVLNDVVAQTVGNVSITAAW